MLFVCSYVLVALCVDCEFGLIILLNFLLKFIKVESNGKISEIYQGTPLNENPSPFPPFGNFFPPYMATLSLPGFTKGLVVWLF